MKTDDALMTNKIAVVIISLVVGGFLYFGLISLGGVIADPSGLLASGEVTVTDGSMHLDRSGTPVVVGEVINDRRGPITNVYVTVVFYNHGERIANVTKGPEVSSIPSKSKSPYTVRLREVSVRPDSYDVFVEYDDSDESIYKGLEVTEVREERIGQDRVQVSGSVENSGGRTVDPSLVVIFYDGNGSVIGIRSGRTSPSTLEPGATGEFQILYNTLGDIPSRARGYADHEVIVFLAE